MGYLLARASDTLADEAELDASLKLEVLQAFIEKDWLSVEKFVSAHYLGSVSHQGERRLLSCLATISAEVEMLDEEEQKQLNWVTELIAEGQRDDVKRFELNRAEMESEQQLLSYCYSVAGCVGEFWTRIGFYHDSSFSSIPQLELESIGRGFGVGLQLVNILRDAPSDLEHGRVYIPGMRELDKQKSDFWRAKANRAMDQGVHYSDSLVNRFSRAAVYLPAVVGKDTLSLLECASIPQWQAGLKVSRSEIFRELLSGLLRNQQ